MRPWAWKKWREKYASELKKRLGRKKTDHGNAYIVSKIHNELKLFKDITLLTLNSSHY